MICDHIVEEKTFKNGTKHLWCPTCKKHVSRDPGSKFDAKSAVLKQRFGDSFYTSPAWLKLRYAILASSDLTCALCGSREKPLHVDHIKPRSKYPALALDKANMQILCKSCNLGKGADHEHDFRGLT